MFKQTLSMNISRFCRCSVVIPREFFGSLPSIRNASNQNKFYCVRNFHWKKSNFQKRQTEFNIKGVRSTRNYFVALGVVTLGFAYAAVPLYRIFCQASGYGGTAKHDLGGEKVENLKKVPHRLFKIKFNSDVSTNFMWKFKPQQREIVVMPGETALAFYTATNPLDKPVIGISTYNILPFEAGSYFNKIQCFCFEEQQLNPKEQVDMPVFFYIDPEICDDPLLENLEEIILSYTFFEAKEGMSFQLPSFLKKSEK